MPTSTDQDHSLRSTTSDGFSEQGETILNIAFYGGFTLSGITALVIGIIADSKKAMIFNDITSYVGTEGQSIESLFTVLEEKYGIYTMKLSRPSLPDISASQKLKYLIEIFPSEMAQIPAQFKADAQPGEILKTIQNLKIIHAPKDINVDGATFIDKENLTDVASIILQMPDEAYLYYFQQDIDNILKQEGISAEAKRALEKLKSSIAKRDDFHRFVVEYPTLIEPLQTYCEKLQPKSERMKYTKEMKVYRENLALFEAKKITEKPTMPLKPRYNKAKLNCLKLSPQELNALKPRLSGDNSSISVIPMTAEKNILPVKNIDIRKETYNESLVGHLSKTIKDTFSKIWDKLVNKIAKNPKTTLLIVAALIFIVLFANLLIDIQDYTSNNPGASIFDALKNMFTGKKDYTVNH